MNRKELLEMRDYYDTHSTADEMTNGGAWETDVDPDPMVTTSLCLPKSLLDWSVSRQPQSTSSQPLSCDDGSSSITPTTARQRGPPSAWNDSNRPYSTRPLIPTAPVGSGWQSMRQSNR